MSLIDDIDDILGAQSKGSNEFVKIDESRLQSYDHVNNLNKVYKKTINKSKFESSKSQIT